MTSVLPAKREIETLAGDESSSKLVRPSADEIGADRKAEEFRNYKDSARQTTVSHFYQDNHRLQTRAVVQKLMEQLPTAPVVEMTVAEAMDLLNSIVDDSDPDTDAAQTFHAFQTAEAARRVFPELKWLHLAGLLHDIGKVLADPRCGGLPQAFVVGDTFPLGCKFQEKVVFSEYFEANPDSQVPEYQTDCGIYQPHCGLRNVLMSFGHDEYLYRVLMDSNTKLPEEALYIIRFHSFYAHHQANAYAHLCDEMDVKMRDILRQFQPCDLYSKSHNFPAIETLRPYYDELLREFGVDKPLRFRRLTMPATLTA